MIALLFGFFVIVNVMEKREGAVKSVALMTVYFTEQSNDPSALQNISNWDDEPRDLECDGDTYVRSYLQHKYVSRLERIFNSKS